MKLRTLLFNLSLVITFTLSIAFLSSTAQAAESELRSLLVYNGTGDTIVEAHLSPAAKCDMIRCGEWLKTSGTLLPIEPFAGAGVLGLPSLEAKDVLICVWDVKIVTQAEDKSKGEHVFKNLDLCKSSEVLVSFVRVSPGVFAIQTYQDEQERFNRIVIASEATLSSWASPDLSNMKAEVGGVGALFYNGLGDFIMGVELARADKCDQYICGKWEARGEKLLPLQPGKAIAALSFREAGSCKWDMKIKLQPVAGDIEERVLKEVDFCQPPEKRSMLSFVRTDYGVFAIHTFKDEQGRIQRILYPSTGA